ncbi:hypothetical protein PUN28_014936 [Cardiocondyla obscurior]|uniref:Uncharacterized protein n=1 Tax=Cardiocondyla obscurior TaxID=286306 RepID=A0AAW2EW71_9HYME
MISTGDAKTEKQFTSRVSHIPTNRRHVGWSACQLRYITCSSMKTNTQCHFPVARQSFVPKAHPERDPLCGHRLCAARWRHRARLRNNPAATYSIPLIDDECRSGREKLRRSQRCTRILAKLGSVQALPSHLDENININSRNVYLWAYFIFGICTVNFCEPPEVRNRRPKDAKQDRTPGCYSTEHRGNVPMNSTRIGCQEHERVARVTPRCAQPLVLPYVGGVLIRLINHKFN